PAGPAAARRRARGAKGDPRYGSPRPRPAGLRPAHRNPHDPDPPQAGLVPRWHAPHRDRARGRLPIRAALMGLFTKIFLSFWLAVLLLGAAVFTTELTLGDDQLRRAVERTDAHAETVAALLADE